MSEFFADGDEPTYEDYVGQIAAFIRRCNGHQTTKRQIGRNVQRPGWLQGPLGSFLQQAGFDVRLDIVRESCNSIPKKSSRSRPSRVRRREDDDGDLPPVRKRRRVSGANNLRVSADLSRIAAGSDALFEYQDVPAVGRDQEAYMAALGSDAPVVYVLGSAGTGKTWLAVQEALRWLHRSQVRRIVITRPAVETDDKMGFLPGSLDDKMQPFLLPVLDAIDQQSSPGTARALHAKDVLKIAALSHMRGTTMTHSFVIADEMQNATFEQLKMLTTRLGRGSKLVVCGDPGQSDRFSAGEVTALAEVAAEVERSEGGVFRAVRLQRVHRSEVARRALALFDRVQHTHTHKRRRRGHRVRT